MFQPPFMFNRTVFAIGECIQNTLHHISFDSLNSMILTYPIEFALSLEITVADCAVIDRKHLVSSLD